jgi:uncharacterized protein (DUF1697 family)
MKAYVALLRGVNVGGKNRVKMPELLSLLSGLGLNRLNSYLQSGNLVFESDQIDSRVLVTAIEKRIQEGLGLDVAVLVKSESEMSGVDSLNPFLKQSGLNSQFLYVTYLFEQPPEDKIKLIENFKDPRDSFWVVDRQVYLHCPVGYGKTKFSNSFFEKQLGMAATTRNWRTAKALKDLAESLRS